MFSRQQFQQQFQQGQSRHGGNKCGGGFGGRGWGGHWAQKMQGFRRVPVNIEENDAQYTILFYAASLSKEAITLKVKDDVLTVSYKGDEAQQQNAESFTHREFTNASFERSFLLNGKVNTENISAAYADGILKITLPKNPENTKPAQHIDVA